MTCIRIPGGIVCVGGRSRRVDKAAPKGAGLAGGGRDERGVERPRDRVMGSTTGAMTTFTLLGEPVAWKRVGTGFSGGRHSYVPREVVNAEKAIGLAYRAAGGGLFDGPVNVLCDFWLAGRTSAAHLDPRDLDNLAKTVLDGLQMVAFTNDRRVVTLIARKALDKNNPRTVVTIGAAT